MRKIKEAILVVVVCLLSVGCRSSSEIEISCSPVGTLSIEPSGKFMFISDDSDFVSVYGRWNRTSGPTRLVPLAYANSAEVSCMKLEGKCYEAVAVLKTKWDGYSEVSSGTARLNVVKVDYQIEEWSDTLIRAISRPRAADIELRISLVDETAERTFTETSARGATGANPTPIHWLLE